MEETTENSAHNGAQNTAFLFRNPCNYLQEAIRSILKCLGFESGEPENSSTPTEKNNKDATTYQDDETSSQVEPLAVPPASSADPPAVDPSADPPAATVLAMAVGRAPPQPPVGRGGGGQNN